MTRHRRSARRVLGAATLIGTGLLGGFAGGGTAASAQVTPVLLVSPGSAAADRPTTVTVSGTGYLVPPHAADKQLMGGVYVLFGWVQPGNSWGPSHTNGVNTDGQFGYSYNYAGISRGADTRDDGTGHNRFVSFTSGGPSGESTEFHMSMDPAYPDNSRGSWTTTITIPGAVYTYLDPVTNAPKAVDCRVVQCGIYTIGAHGVKSQTNERFFPISFATTGGSAPVAPVTVSPATQPAGGGLVGTSPVPGAVNPAGGLPGVVVNPNATAKPNGTAKPGTTAKSGATTAPAASTTLPAVAPVEVAGASTVPGDSVAPSTTPPDVSTSVPSTSSKRRSSTDVAQSASGKVIVFEGDDGVGPLVWGVGLGVPVAAAAGGFLLWRRRFNQVPELHN